MASSKERKSSSSTSSRPPRKPQRTRRWSRETGVQLSIDTTGPEEGMVVLCDSRGRSLVEKRFSLERHHSGALLRAIDDALQQAGRSRNDVRSISVVPGPGTFSRVRLGVVTANALAWALGVPLMVRGKRVRIVKPIYGKPPNIG